MAIHVKNGDLKVVVGASPLKSVLIGPNRVYGDDLSKFDLEYPSMPEGVNYIVKVNNSKLVENPSVAGTLTVNYGDNIVIRVYAKEGYANPISSVQNRNVAEKGETYYVRAGNDDIARATTYTYVVKGNGRLTVQTAQAAPKIRVRINKDEGVNTVSFKYIKSPYDFEFSYNNSLSSTEHTVNTNHDYYDLSYASNIVSVDDLTAREGYKTGEVSSNYLGVITGNDECMITASSVKGRKVKLLCPALPNGLEWYRLSLVSSQFSRNQRTTVFYEGTETAATIETRNYEYATCYLYEEDVIQIVASRKEGYKLPSLGIQGDVSNSVLEKQVTLANDSSLVVAQGEAGVRINFENEALASGEFVLLDVSSEFNDGNIAALTPPIYMGDRISIPLNPQYRIGTLSKRKPGVGLSDGSNIIESITFSSSINYIVPATISKLKIVLEQGADRIESTSFNPPSRILDMRNEGRYNSKVWGQGGIDDNVVPVAGLGSEGFFLKSLTLIYYTKRYLGDIIGDKFYKHKITNLKSSFSCSCESNLGITYRGVLEGNLTISEDKTSVNMQITEYKKTWVANTTHGVYLFAYEIII